MSAYARLHLGFVAAVLGCLALPLAAFADPVRSVVSGACTCPPEGIAQACLLVPLVAGEVFDMTDVAIASANGDPVTVDLSNSVGGGPGAASYALTGFSTVTQFYLSAIHFDGAGGGVFASCLTLAGTNAQRVRVTVSGVKTTP